MTTPIITAAVRIDLETARPHVIQAIRRISRDVTQSALYSRLASIRDDMDTLIDELDRAERGLIILPRNIECFDCGNDVVNKYGVFACYECGYLEDADTFAARLHEWDASRAEADYMHRLEATA